MIGLIKYLYDYMSAGLASLNVEIWETFDILSVNEYQNKFLEYST